MCDVLRACKSERVVLFQVSSRVGGWAAGVEVADQPSHTVSHILALHF